MYLLSSIHAPFSPPFYLSFFLPLNFGWFGSHYEHGWIISLFFKNTKVDLWDFDSSIRRPWPRNVFQFRVSWNSLRSEYCKFIASIAKKERVEGEEGRKRRRERGRERYPPPFPTNSLPAWCEDLSYYFLLSSTQQQMADQEAILPDATPSYIRGKTMPPSWTQPSR